MKDLISISYQGDIDAMSEELFQLLCSQKLPHKTALRIKLLYENLLLDITQKGLTDITLQVNRSFMSIRIILSYAGANFNPLIESSFEDAGTAEFNALFYKNIGLSASHAYQGGRNSITGIYQSPPSLSVPDVFVPILLAVLTALGLKAWLPQQTQDLIITELVHPTFTILLKIILLMISPLVFFSQIESIASFDHLQSLNQLFAVFLKRAAKVMLIFAASATALGMLLWGNVSSGAQAGVSLRGSDFVAMIPDSLLAPFLNSDLLQILVIATLIGIGLLSLGSRKNQVLESVSILKDTFTYLLKVFCKLMPAFIFVSILSAFLQTDQAALLEIMKALILIILLELAALAIYLAVIARRTGIKPQKLAEAIRKPVMLAFATASSFAARSEMYDTARTQLHADEKISQFVINTGSVVLWPASVFNNILCVIFVVRSFSAASLLPFMIASIFMAIATPSVTGGGVVIATAMLQIAGASDMTVGLQMYILMSLITDYLVTAGNVCGTMLETHYCNVLLNKPAKQKK